MRRHWVIAVCFAGGLSFSASPSEAAVRDYAEMSLEQLMKIEITSAAKRPVSIGDTPAAAFVLTNEDIRRSGARSIPEALRMVPGLSVAQITASSWAISSRGFNGRFANKLLVLIDGRSVYTPLYSGVYWDRQDTLLEDIDRIEVIRGPGASLWGANAVNGVINIITKNARDTQGTYMAAGAGTNDEAEVAIRHGGTLGDLGHYRVFGKAFNQGDRVEADGTDGADDWRAARSGFRMDLTDARGNDWHFQGGTYANVVGEAFISPTLTTPYSQRIEADPSVSGTYFLGGWSRDLAPDNRVEVRTYFDRAVGSDQRLGEERDTVDVDASHRFLVGGRHSIVWGLGARYSRDTLSESRAFAFEPDSDGQYLINSFAQDTIALWDGAVEFTIGTKLEYNSYTGVELQPNVRALWHVNSQHAVWAAVSRAVRTPSRAERDIDASVAVAPPSAFVGLPTDLRVLGSTDTTTEELLAFEAGHRWAVNEHVSFDLATFYNVYDHLTSATAGSPFFSTAGGIPHLVLPVNVGNDGEAEVYGFELLGNWQPLADLRLQGWYAFLQPDSDAAADPSHQAGLRVLYNLSPTVTLDSFARFVSELDSADIDAYAELAIRIAWRPQPNIELALAGQNLLHDRRSEFGEDSFTGTRPTKVERSVFGTVTLRF